MLDFQMTFTPTLYSDGVLNPSGVRFGSAEIYGVLERFFSSPAEGIDDAICVGQRRPDVDNNERVLLFVKMRDNKQLTRDLEARIKDSIAKHLSIRHVPAYIFQIEEIPVRFLPILISLCIFGNNSHNDLYQQYTVNGKKIEIAVKQIVSGSNMKPSGTVANPEALQYYYKYRDLEQLVGQRDTAKQPKPKL